MIESALKARDDLETVTQAAARWHDRIRGSAIADDERVLFENWLAESDGHRRAYESVQRTYSILLRESYHSRVLELRHEAGLRLSRRAMRFTGWRTSTVAAVRAVAFGCLLIVAPRLSELPSSSMVSDAVPEIVSGDALGERLAYSTGVGERLTVTLVDGSQVILNTETTLYADLSKSQRHIELARGQALFEVAKDPSRPFIVQAHDRRFVALGTAFDVRLEGDALQITMIEGHVRVEHTASAGSGVQRPRRAQTEFVATLSAGEQLTVDKYNVEHVDTVDAERVTSWCRGQLIFDNSRLADAVEEFNRYSSTRIELADAELKELRISGSFSTGRPQVFIEALASYFPIQVNHGDDKSVVLRSSD